MQASQHILLVRPSTFVFNEETASTNAFQQTPTENQEALRAKAIGEFDFFAEKLMSEGVDVTVIEDSPYPVKPDAVFPNNWISFHEDGTVVLYPMYAPNRRTERRPEVIDALKKKFDVRRVMDLSRHEDEGRILEGTGSIIFDRTNRVAYACLSPRTNKDLFTDTAENLGYRAVYFNARDRSGQAIYHTNVMMCVAEQFAVICLESINDPAEKSAVRESLKNTGHRVIPISFSQMTNFAGNMLALKNKQGSDLLILSQSAYDCLSDEQKQNISAFCKMVPVPIRLIETIGGGSARCMIAEIFLPLKK